MHALKLGAAALAASCILAWSGTAMAGGYGFFFEYGRNIAAPGGDEFFTAVDSLGLLDSFDRNEIGFGFSLDTNVAQDRLFNYRFDFGYHRSMWANDDLISTALASFLGSSNGIMINNAFGFGLLRTPAMRLWLGPAIRMNFDYYGDGEAFDYQLGVGPQLGLNFHLGDKVSLVLSSAYNYKWGWILDTSVFDEGVTAHRDHYVSVNLALLFRSSGDIF